MNISFPFLLVMIVLYGVCTAVAIGFILRLRARARCENQTGAKSIFPTFRDIVALAALPIVASIAVFFAPAVVRGIFIGEARPALQEAGAFAVAQLIWSIPSACFHVLGTRLLRERFSLRKIVGYTMLSLVALGLVSLLSRSALPQFLAGMIAQVVAGVLPMSALSSLPAKISISINSGSMGIDWQSVSFVRASSLCAAVVLGYLLLKPRVFGHGERIA